MKPIILTILLGLSQHAVAGLVTKGNVHPQRIHDVVYYDDSFCFVVPGYDDSRDDRQTIEPGLFVHSKAHGAWLQIEEIPTSDGTFGKSDLRDKRLAMAAVAWDFPSLRQQEFAEIPLHTSGSICFPEEIVYDETNERYRLGFLTSRKVPEAATFLYIKRRDLIEAFEKNTRS